ncbi:unnamed protein product [Arabis nemorensis]|uniref:Uncharacterized protein n=1 Tax=Arabis nemorensis TaxID=586526 RepID=A0A565CFX6_9BRAS|nr:unnamed protein product [Arabis nemorensis]
MAKMKHAKNAAPVADISLVKNSVNPMNQNSHVGETSKSKKAKPVEDTTMQCSNDDKAPVEDLSPVKYSATKEFESPCHGNS